MGSAVPQSIGVAYKNKISNECRQILKNSVAMYQNLQQILFNKKQQSIGDTD
jgi:hypothetical protein